MKRKVRLSNPKKTTSVPVGPRIIRAWFGTVINPVLRQLEREESHIASKNWTWQFRPEGLESIRHISAFVELGARDNFEQILDIFPKIREAVSKHDKAVDLVTEGCKQLQRTLGESDELRETYQKTISPDSLKEIAEDFGVVGQYGAPDAILKKLFGAYPESDHLDLLAQLIVNNTGDLPSYFTCAPLWNRYQDEYLALLNHPGIQVSYKSLLKAGDALAQRVAQIIRILRETRLELSIKHDVPYVDLRESNFEGVG